MRPYSGIGVVCIHGSNPNDRLPLYEEPGLLRSGTIQPAAIYALTSWLFGADSEPYLLVTARKGEWLRIERDDAGREAWLQAPHHRLSYTPWEQFLKGKTISFLRNAPKKLLLLHPQPGAGTGSPLSTASPMKVITVRNDWCYVLFDKTNAGWIRWRDQDSRLLVGIAPPTAAQSR